MYTKNHGYRWGKGEGGVRGGCRNKGPGRNKSEVAHWGEDYFPFLGKRKRESFLMIILAQQKKKLGMEKRGNGGTKADGKLSTSLKGLWGRETGATSQPRGRGNGKKKKKEKLGGPESRRVRETSKNMTA